MVSSDLMSPGIFPVMVCGNHPSLLQPQPHLHQCTLSMPFCKFGVVPARLLIISCSSQPDMGYCKGSEDDWKMRCTCQVPNGTRCSTRNSRFFNDDLIGPGYSCNCSNSSLEVGHIQRQSLPRPRRRCGRVNAKKDHFRLRDCDFNVCREGQVAIGQSVCTMPFVEREPTDRIVTSFANSQNNLRESRFVQWQSVRIPCINNLWVDIYHCSLYIRAFGSNDCA